MRARFDDRRIDTCTVGDLHAVGSAMLVDSLEDFLTIPCRTRRWRDVQNLVSSEAPALRKLIVSLGVVYELGCLRQV